MDIIELFDDKINGVLSTFDRIIIRGHLQALYNHGNRMFYLYEENVLLKDFSKYAQEITDKIKLNASELANSVERPYIYLQSSKKSKEEIAKKILKEKPVKEGLICVLQVTEPCISTDIFKKFQLTKSISKHSLMQVSNKKTLTALNFENDKKIRNKVTRILAKLRAHKIIKKIPHSFKYSVTKLGIKILSGVLQIKRIELPKLFNENYSVS